MTINDYNEIFKNPTNKNMVLTFSEDGEQDIIITNSHICSEEMSLQQSLCENEGLQFGSCIASCYKVTIVNNGNFIDKNVNVVMNIENPEDQLKPFSVKYGLFKVRSDELSNDRMWRTLTCYDSMYDILNADVASWFESLTFPMSIKNLRDSFFNYLSIQQKAVSLINDNFITDGGFISEGKLSGKTVIESICQLNGVFGHINVDGLFEYISVPSQETITYDWYIDGSGKYEDYMTDKITGILVRDNDDDIGTSVGTNDNQWIIVGNPLVYGKEGTQDLINALTNLFNAIKDISYRPFSIETYGNPTIPIGTNIKLNVKRYDTEQGYSTFELNSILINRELLGIQGLTDHLTAEGDKALKSEVNNIQSEIFRTKGKVHDLRVTVDELYSEIYDADTGIISTISQMSNEIVLKVDSSGHMVEVGLGVDADSSGATRFQVNADNISFFANNVLEMTANNIAFNSTYFQVDEYGHVTAKSFTAPGQIFTTIIEPDVMDVVNNLDDDVYVSIVAQAFTRPLYGDEYTSGQINISDGDYESHLTSRDLFINMVNANQVNVLGTYHRVIEDLYDCGYMISILNEETDLYSGFIRLSGEDADIQINEKSALRFEDGEPFYCDFRGAGFITTNASKVWFTIGIPKSAYGKTISCVDFVGRVRVDGKYIFGTRNTMPPIVATANVTSDGYHLQVALTRGVDAQQNLIPYGNKKKLNNRVVGIDVDGTFIFSDPIPEVIEEEEEA